MISRPLLLADLQRLLKKLEADLRTRSESEPAIKARLTTQFEAARAARRTAAAYTVWRDDLVTQVGVAWILGCVFVRFLEDNDLLDQPFLSGPGERLRAAGQQREDYFRAQPIHSDRDYLEHVFRTVKALPTLDGIFDERRNPLWQFGPSGDAATELLRFWQSIEPDTGALRHDFTDPAFRPSTPETVPVSAGLERSTSNAQPSTLNSQPPASDLPDPTRFLGDLYQDLSESARKQYALLQTPRFVEEFILDRTLTPAIETFGLAVVRMIDPTCGSGHFVLGSFERLLELWRRREPGTPVRELVQRALDAVHGVDLNPFAVAIARFRLLIAALRACDIRRLRHAPAFRIHVASGDSLLHGRRFREFENAATYQPTFDSEEAFRDELKHHYEVEDAEALHRILGRQYHAVVGNPPYITVKDRALSELYRARYGSCSGKYSLSVPFMERFFDLAVKGGVAGRVPSRGAEEAQPRDSAHSAGSGDPAYKPAGFTGQITANSFMKREFGKKLIEQIILRWDLTHVIDTSGAYIPGHGTPTVILFGKNQPPVSDTIRTVLGIRGEPATPSDPAQGLVWQAILKQIDVPGSTSEWVSAADSPRANFHRHPWSIGGGGAAELKEQLDDNACVLLGKLTESIGFMGIISEDDAFVAGRSYLRRQDLPHRSFVTGDSVRDWVSESDEGATFPYGESEHDLKPLRLSACRALHRTFWPNRTPLRMRKMFGKHPLELGLEWFEFIYFTAPRYLAPQLIAFASVGTHNHFVSISRGAVLNRHAPVMKLRSEFDPSEHTRLLGTLNSSTACFWMKQVFFPKGGDQVGSHGARVRKTLWDERYEFDGTKLAAFPLPARQPTQLSTLLVQTSTAQQGQTPTAVLARELDGAVSGPPAGPVPASLSCPSPGLTSSQPGGLSAGSRGLSAAIPPERGSPEGPHPRGVPEATPARIPGPPSVGVVDLRAVLDQARARWTVLRQRMIAFQEELDWQVYEAYGLVAAEDRVSLPEDPGERTRPRVPGSAPSPNPSGMHTDSRAGAPGSAREGACAPLEEGACAPPELPEDGIQLGERAFEIVMARKMAAGELQTTWFERHGSTPITEIPAHWPAAYRALVERRIARIESDPNIRLIEQPEYKRRWNTEPWEDQLERALRQWLLTRLEQYFHGGERMAGSAGGPVRGEATRTAPGAGGLLGMEELRASWPAGQQPVLVTTHRLADCARADADFLRVAEVYRGRVDFDVAALVAELVADESVPFLPVQRYKETGLRKRAVWEQVWELQRREDEVEAEVSGQWAAGGGQSSVGRSEEELKKLVREAQRQRVGEIPVPPKYSSADFKAGPSWRLRGKLDVPKERWVSYPGIEQDPAGGLVIAWAGWDHLQQARALAAWYEELRGGGAPDAKLLLVLAGLQQLVPWLIQWHNELDPEFGVRMGDYFRDYVADETRRLGKTEGEFRQVAYGR